MNRLMKFLSRGQTQTDRSGAYLVEDETKYGYMEGDDDNVKEFKRDIFTSMSSMRYTHGDIQIPITITIKQISYTPTLNDKLRSIVNPKELIQYPPVVTIEYVLDEIKYRFSVYLINYIKYNIDNTPENYAHLSQSVIELNSNMYQFYGKSMFIQATHTIGKEGNTKYIFTIELDVSEQNGQPYHYIHPSKGGSKKSLYKKTSEKVTLGSLTRIIYTNKNGTKFIKQKGEYVLLSKAKKQAK